MIFILLLTLTAITVIGLPKLMAETAGNGAWLTLIITSVIFAAAAYIIVSLSRIHNGEVMYDYSARLIGKVGAYVLGVYYFLYFLIISSFLCATMSNILVSNFFTHTPTWAVVAISLPFYAHSAYQGVTNVARICKIFGVVFAIGTIAGHVIMMIQGTPEYVLPLFVSADTGRYLKAVIPAMPSFMGVEVLALLPIAEKDRKKAPRVALFTVLAIGLLYVLTVEGDLMMVGMNEVINENNSMISAIRQIELPFLDFFERLDILYLTAGFMGLFAAKTIVITAALEFACRLLPRVSRALVVAGISIAVFCIDLVLLQQNELGRLFEAFTLTAGNVAALVIPVALLILTKVKQHANKTA